APWQTELFDLFVAATRWQFARDQQIRLCRGPEWLNRVREYLACLERSVEQIAHIALGHEKNRMVNRAQPSQSNAASGHVANQVERRDSRMQDHRKAT